MHADFFCVSLQNSNNIFEYIILSGYDNVLFSGLNKRILSMYTNIYTYVFKRISIPFGSKYDTRIHPVITSGRVVSQRNFDFGIVLISNFALVMTTINQF